MAFRATNTLPETGYNSAKALARKIKNLASARAAQFASGGDTGQVVAVMEGAIDARDQYAQLSSIPGIGAYAQEQENDPAYNVVTEFQNLQAAIDDVVTACVAVLPTSGNGFKEVYSLDAAGAKSYNALSAGDMTALVAALQALDAQIV